jgi:hypothetical protein
MDVADAMELLVPVVDLREMDPGAILVEIAYPYDVALGDPAIHYFQVVERAGERVTIAGIGKERIAGREHATDPIERVQPIPDSFVRGCRRCHAAHAGVFGRPDEPLASFQAIDDARWFAHEGTGARHDEASPAFEHAFADYVPTATLAMRFYADEPYLRPAASSAMLYLDRRGDHLRRVGSAPSNSSMPRVRR